MGTRNRMMFDKLIQNYTNKGQVKVKGNRLEILEQNEKKKQQIMWSLAEYSPELTLQLMKNWHKKNFSVLYT